MEMKPISAAAMLLLTGLFLVGCEKTIPRSKNAVAEPAANVRNGNAETNLVSRDLGTVTLTNHYETSVSLGAGKDCLITPKMLDGHNMQLTLAVESKTAKGKVCALSITQVVARSGKPFEVAVGDFSFSLTPIVTAE